MNEILIGDELQVSILLQLWVLIHEYDDFFLVLKNNYIYLNASLILGRRVNVKLSTSYETTRAWDSTVSVSSFWWRPHRAVGSAETYGPRRHLPCALKAIAIVFIFFPRFEAHIHGRTNLGISDFGFDWSPWVCGAPT